MIERSQCPLCEGEKFKVIENLKYDNSKYIKFIDSNYQMGAYLKNKKYVYQLRFCTNCGTRYQGFVLDNNETKKLYSENINLKTSLIKQFQNFNKYKSIRIKTAKLINRLIKTNSKKKYEVLEVGAGWGIFAYLSSKYNLNITTLEISKERRQFHELLKLKTFESFEEIINNGLKFDVVYSNQVLEHIVDLKSFIINCSDVLNKGGYFIAEYPSYNNFLHYSFKRGFYFNDIRTKALEHLQLISDKGAKEIFRDFDNMYYVPFYPIRKFGDRIRNFIHLITPFKHRGKGFIVAKKLK